jgi:hypothetical protein
LLPKNLNVTFFGEQQRVGNRHSIEAEVIKECRGGREMSRKKVGGDGGRQVKEIVDQDRENTVHPTAQLDPITPPRPFPSPAPRP